MTNKYNYSFELEVDNIPGVCPICGYEFDSDDCLDTSPYKDGFRTMLICENCNFKKVLSYEKDVDFD